MWKVKETWQSSIGGGKGGKGAEAPSHIKSPPYDLTFYHKKVFSGLGSACDPEDPGLIPRWCCLLLFP